MPTDGRRILVAAGAGAVFAMLLATVNVYVGLRTGWWESGGVLASLLGAAVLARAFGPVRPGELALLQTTASAGAAMPSVIGILGVIPALTLLHAPAPTWLVLSWGVAVGAFGLAVSVMDARRFVDGPAPFPSAVATVTVITSFAAGQTPAQRRLPLMAALSSGALAWLRDGLHWIPETLSAGGPGSVASIMASPMLLGLGLLSGARIGLSLAAGGLLAWGVAQPLASSQGVLPQGVYDEASRWLLWPGVGVMIGASLANGLSAIRGFKGVQGGAEGARSSRLLAIVATTALVMAVLTTQLFGLPLFASVALAVLAVPACSLCVRTVATLGIAPIGQFGQAGQLLASPLSPTAAANIGAGAIVSSSVAQAAQTIESLKIGALTRVPRGAQLWGIGLGALVGAVVALFDYGLLTRGGALGGPSLPVPGAAPFKTLGELAASGASALPPGGVWALAAGLVVGLVLELLSKRSWAPATLALGLGFMVPPGLALTVGLGALLSSRLEPERAQLIGAGGLIGESLVGTALALTSVL